MKPTIQTQNDLASYPQIDLFIYQLLTAAQVGGLTESRARELDAELHGYFSNISGATFWPFREELIRVLMTADRFFEPLEDDGFDFSDQMN